MMRRLGVPNNLCWHYHRLSSQCQHTDRTSGLVRFKVPKELSERSLFGQSQEILDITFFEPRIVMYGTYVFLLKEFMYSYCCLCTCILIVRPCILIVVYVFLLLSMYVYSYCCLCILIVVHVILDAATLTEVFPCFFPGCEANARV